MTISSILQVFHSLLCPQDMAVTKNNTTWFAVKDKGIKMITDFEGGLLITEWGYTYPLLVYDITRADIGYNTRNAQKIMKMYA
jgi:hypothetical protein